MNFGHALEILKRKGYVARKGWNGKQMGLRLEEPFGLQRAHLQLMDAQGLLVPWTPSQTDVLEEDWVELRLIESGHYRDPTVIRPWPFEQVPEDAPPPSGCDVEV